MSEEYISLLRQASGEIWTLFKVYIGIKKNDDDKWQELFDYCNKICEKYKGTQAETYVRKYIVEVIIAEIERVSKL